MDAQKNIKLCPKCKIGYDSYTLDTLSPICPYLGSHTGESCGYFVEMSTDKSYKGENE